MQLIYKYNIGIPVYYKLLICLVNTPGLCINSKIWIDKGSKSMKLCLQENSQKLIQHIMRENK